MLVAPAMPPMSRKRSLSCHTTNIHRPSLKRSRVNTSNDKHTENDDLLLPDDGQSIRFRVLPHITPKLSTAGIGSAYMKEVQLSFVVRDQSPLSVIHPLSPATNGMWSNGNTCKPVTSEVHHHPVDVVDSGKGNEEMQTIKDDVMMRSVTDNGESACLSSTESDVDSVGDNSETAIPKSKLKQPAIVLMKLNPPVKKRQVLSTSCPVSLSTDSGVVVGGYVHRMANLNARACVAAFLQPEKSPSRVCRHSEKSFKSKAKKISNNTKRKHLTQCVSKVEFSSSKAVILNVNGSIPVINVNGKGIQIPTHTVIVRDQVDEEIPYNSMGLLYNGDTLHPSARVFLTRSAKNELEMPRRVFPTLVPSKRSTVRKAIINASTSRTVHYIKKGFKKNNGWNPLGKPIKVVRNDEGLIKKYYAGIKRRKEEIYVRDCVIINAGTVKSESPYVAKIGSIWQEPDGLIMMTTFWYYRSEDIEVQRAGIHCVPKELLASQHHDSNSVECIEDKCYVVGLSQYSRYVASDVNHTSTRSQLSGISLRSLVPHISNKTASLCLEVKEPIARLNTESDEDSLVELDPTKQIQGDVELNPSLSELQQVDPSLVFLCYRGFNHISGKLQTGRAVLTKV